MWLQGALGLNPSSWTQPQSTQPLAWRTSGRALRFASSVLVLLGAPGLEEWTKGEVEPLAALLGTPPSQVASVPCPPSLELCKALDG